jgi:hypothetical protein
MIDEEPVVERPEESVEQSIEVGIAPELARLDGAA